MYVECMICTSPFDTGSDWLASLLLGPCGTWPLGSVSDDVGIDLGVTVVGFARPPSGSFVTAGPAKRATPFPRRNCTPSRGKIFIHSRQGMSLPGCINTGTTT